MQILWCSTWRLITVLLLLSQLQVHEEFKQNVENIGIDNLIQKFAEQKGTGKERPGEVIGQDTSRKEESREFTSWMNALVMLHIVLQLWLVSRNTWRLWPLKVARRVEQKPSGSPAWARGTRSPTPREFARTVKRLKYTWCAQYRQGNLHINVHGNQRNQSRFL